MLSDEKATLGRALAGGDIPLLAMAVVKNMCPTRDVLKFLNLIDEECCKLCKKIHLFFERFQSLNFLHFNESGQSMS